ncbi:WhiB family transcriptional regulator [Cellulomonas sp. zg-ZUI22]|uniref:WhiB family transcriptional regulator n=1 Tax=Cellulomonas sp. zg-ZUI22 TaxID=2816955 RepID=UPI001A94E832|nr:WhiB family transcriptional regulator [Cellulomonas sp. zg-ZUI22]MBO0900855.1 WhiB family transcriptional regulator [Cellulomonas sp. zg-ZUI22]
MTCDDADPANGLLRGGDYEPDEVPSYEQLVDHLLTLTAAGRSPLCVLREDPRFTSHKATEQAAAARTCRRCRALTPCRAYGEANPRDVGVYGGLTERAARRLGG